MYCLLIVFLFCFPFFIATVPSCETQYAFDDDDWGEVTEEKTSK